MWIEVPFTSILPLVIGLSALTCDKVTVRSSSVPAWNDENLSFVHRKKLEVSAPGVTSPSGANVLAFYLIFSVALSKVALTPAPDAVIRASTVVMVSLALMMTAPAVIL